MSEGPQSPAPKSNNNKLIIGGAVALMLLGCCMFVLLIVLLSSPSSGSTAGGSRRPTRTPRAAQQPTSIVVQPTQPLTGGSGEVGLSRSNPAPVGTTMVSEHMAFTVGEVIRPADQVIHDGNPFNTTPEPGNEMIMVKVTIACQASDKCQILTGNLSLVGSSGIGRDPELVVAGVPGMMDFSTEFYNGATLSGNIAFEVTIGETNLTLIYSPFLDREIFLLVQ